MKIGKISTKCVCFTVTLTKLQLTRTLVKIGQRSPLSLDKWSLQDTLSWDLDL